MKAGKRRRAWVHAVVAIACSGCADVAPDRIREVESGLRPAVVLAGSEVPTWTIEERLDHHAVPGVSVAVIDGGEIAWARGYGMADPAEGTPVTPATLFQAASISKPVAATAALLLVQEGRLALDEPINGYLSGWTVPDNALTSDSAVTLRGIVTHSAGLTVWGFPGYQRDVPVPDVVAVLDGSPPANTDPVRVWKVPGTSFRYSGGGYTVMQKAIEDVTGVPFAEYMRTAVLEPAGMTESTYEQPLPEERWDQAARGHGSDGVEIEGEWHTYPEMAAAGLWTTPTDLAHLAIELQRSWRGESSEILSPETTRAFLAPGPHNGWGLGFEIQGRGEAMTFGHGGSNAGFRAALVAFVERGQGAAVMTNGDGGSNLAAEIIRAVSAAYEWPTHKPEVRETVALTAVELAAFVGSYRVPEVEWDFRVTVRDGLLHLESGDGWPTALHPESRTRFFRIEDGMDVVFELGADGQATAFVLAEEIRAERR